VPQRALTIDIGINRSAQFNQRPDASGVSIFRSKVEGSLAVGWFKTK